MPSEVRNGCYSEEREEEASYTQLKPTALQTPQLIGGCTRATD